jgi:hypothetical protein
MNFLPSVKEIIKVDGYNVTCLFSDGKVLVIDFLSWILPRVKDDNIYSKLLDKEVFNTIGCNGITIYWPDLAKVTQLDGTIEPCEFDLDPIMLYEFATQKEFLNHGIKH